MAKAESTDIPNTSINVDTSNASLAETDPNTELATSYTEGGSLNSSTESITTETGLDSSKFEAISIQDQGNLIAISHKQRLF